MFRFFRRKQRKPTGKDATAVSESRPPIYEFIRSRIDPESGALVDSMIALPDAERFEDPQGVRWATGAMDGVMGHHVGAPEDHKEMAEEVVRHVVAALKRPTPQNRATLCELILKESVLGFIDPVLERILGSEDIRPDAVQDLGFWLVTQSPDRNPVKLGIALLGLIDHPANREVFMTLGLHEEFTLYATVALQNTGEGATERLWELAKRVQGWGRVHVVERLVETENPEIREWLLREGFRNRVMDEYLAYACAVGGGLLAALSRDPVDDELVNSAGEMIVALINGGPAQDINDYEDAVPVLRRYVSLISDRQPKLEDLLAIHRIYAFLEDDETDWEAQRDNGWSADVRDQLWKECRQIMDRPVWRPLLQEQLKADDDQAFGLAKAAAGILGVDLWERFWERLQQKPLEAFRWFDVMESCNEERIGAVLEFAEHALPLGEIATGPSAEDDIGPATGALGCLEFVLQELEHYPGRGWRLIRAGLRSPSVRGRNMAIKALSSWERSGWTGDIEAVVQRAIENEPDDEMKGRLQALLAGDPIDWESRFD